MLQSSSIHEGGHFLTNKQLEFNLVQMQYAGVQRSNLQLLYPLQKLSMLLLPQQLVKQYGYGECFTDVGQKQEHRTTIFLR